MCCVGMRWLRGRLAVGLCVPPAAPRLGGAPTSATPAAPSGSTVPWVCRANSTGLSTQRCNYRWVTARAPTPAPRQPPHVMADARGRGRGVSAPRGSQLSLRPECRPQSWWALSCRRGWGAVTAAGRGRGRNGDTQPGTGGARGGSYHGLQVSEGGDGVETEAAPRTQLHTTAFLQRFITKRARGRPGGQSRSRAPVEAVPARCGAGARLSAPRRRGCGGWCRRGRAGSGRGRAAGGAAGDGT